MLILVDSREQRPYSFERFDVEVVRGTVPVGDYTLPGLESQVSIERKSVDDLVACLMGSNRDRFSRELSKLRFYELAAVVVEATLDDVSKGRFRSKMKSHAALQSVITFQVRYRVPFMWAGNRAGGEYLVHSMLSKYLDEVRKRYEATIKSQDKAA